MFRSVSPKRVYLTSMIIFFYHMQCKLNSKFVYLYIKFTNSVVNALTVGYIVMRGEGGE